MKGSISYSEEEAVIISEVECNEISVDLFVMF